MLTQIKRHTPQSVKALYWKARSFMNKRRDERVLRIILKQALHRKGTATSVSDNGRYPFVCYLASKDENIFSTFKSNPIYRYVLEHVTEEQGREYLDVISEYNPFNAQDWQEFAKNDMYGSPRMYTYDLCGMNTAVSPTTIRYAKVLCDILNRFNAGEIKSIAEIGIGYGGQCRIIRTKLPDVHYTLIDLPEVIGLAEKYLTRYEDSRENIRYVDGVHLYLNDDYDLVISNYAFSELRREVQDMYLDKVILRSKRGYITWNSLALNAFGGYSVDELLNKIPGSVRIDERPLTNPDNCIIIWG